MTDIPRLVLDRRFDAPRALVWKCWTDPELLARWYGPGVETIIHQFDPKAGGIWLNEMKWTNGGDLSRMEFQEVVEPEKLVFRQSSANEAWEARANPGMPDWPRVILTTVTFADEGDKTLLRLVWEPVDATEAELACFAAMSDKMGGGWGGGFAVIDEILAELQA